MPLQQSRVIFSVGCSALGKRATAPVNHTRGQFLVSEAARQGDDKGWWDVFSHRPSGYFAATVKCPVTMGRDVPVLVACADLIPHRSRHRHLRHRHRHCHRHRNRPPPPPPPSVVTATATTTATATATVSRYCHRHRHHRHRHRQSSPPPPCR